MNVESNKALARSYIEALDRRDIEAAVALVAPDLVNHTAIPEAQGADGLRRILGKVHRAFPDQRTTCEDVIAEGDRVVCRLTLRGTHSGPLEFVRWPIPPTGKTVASTAIHVYRISGGKIAEQWGAMDALGMLRQLGLTPRPEAHT